MGMGLISAVKAQLRYRTTTDLDPMHRTASLYLNFIDPSIKRLAVRAFLLPLSPLLLLNSEL